MRRGGIDAVLAGVVILLGVAGNSSGDRVSILQPAATESADSTSRATGTLRDAGLPGFRIAAATAVPGSACLEADAVRPSAKGFFAIHKRWPIMRISDRPSRAPSTIPEAISA
jgi:hypothetical protein